MNKSPIGIFDSGIGGLSIAAAIHQLMPREDILYYADTANLPYGRKTSQELQQISKGAIEHLVDQGCKLIVIACNTASTTSLEYVRGEIPGVPIVGVVPMVKPAAQMSRTGVIAVMMTPGTLAAGYYHDLKKDYALNVQVVDEACPDWVEMAETGRRDMGEIRLPLERALAAGADVIVLGCTHFPLLLPEIREAVGDKIQVIHPAPAIARQVKRLLDGLDLVNPSGAGEVNYEWSGHEGLIKAIGNQMLGTP